VTGVLLGRSRGDTAESKSSTAQTVVEITDSIPLLHGIVLAPMLEVALMQVEEFSKSKKWDIVGLYHAAELMDNNDDRHDHSIVEAVIEHIADKIHSFFPLACLLTVINSKINPKPNDIAVQLWTKRGNEWKRQVEGDTIEYETNETPERVRQYIDQGLQFQLCDFDNHLDDIFKDWTNENLFPSKHPQ
jgi:hypothetical protein